jgi:phenylpropionate dioxygenase-like ring-hydroxylating dioxygenase large terminal subunit
LIADQWYAILDARELKNGKPLGVKRLGEDLVLWRTTEGEIACLRDQCLHRGAALSVGKLVDGHVQCPFHGLEFDLTGRCTYIPAYGRNHPIPKVFQTLSYPAREAFGFIWIWWGQAPATLPPVRFFDSIGEDFVHDTFTDHWPIHYARVIENQLDAIHLPFVHYNTIGRGNRLLVDGPFSSWADADGDPQRLDIWVHNRVDDGSRPLKPSEMSQPARHPSLQFRLPNVWHNWISDDMRITIAFVPIDENNTRLYIRTYQKSVKIPILRELFLLASRAGSYIIERQDRRVVITQRPSRPYHRMGETLLSGDGPVIEYRRKRAELIEEANRTVNTG